MARHVLEYIYQKIATQGAIFCVLLVLLASMVAGMIIGGIPVGFAISIIPFVIIGFFALLAKPFYCFTMLFIINYFIIALIRYSRMGGFSVLFDGLILLSLVSVGLNYYFKRSQIGYKGQTNQHMTVLLAAAGVWSLYCIMQIVNPSALVERWFLSRGIMLYMLLTAIVVFLIFDKFKKVESILFIYSILTILGIGKAVMQQVVGFDWVERIELDEGLAKTHFLISGARYFSIFPSAGIFGAAMGHAMVVFSITAIYAKRKRMKVYYLLVAFASFYGLMISGTRGTLAIPAGGFILFIILSKQVRLMVPTFLICTFVYLFLAHTYIGQSNAQIRRARTIFDPNEPSLIVRLENQKKFAEYLKNKPFGEGLGLSGVDVKGIERFTTSIPTDSWYVKIWVETGIVGLVLHISVLTLIILYGCYILLFKIKDPYVRGVLSALHCGTFGILIASYGNQVLGQYPIGLLTYMSMGLVFMGCAYDEEMQTERAVSKFTT